MLLSIWGWMISDSWLTDDNTDDVDIIADVSKVESNPKVSNDVAEYCTDVDSCANVEEDSIGVLSFCSNSIVLGSAEIEVN